MASSPLYHDGSVGELLGEGPRVKRMVRVVTETFADGALTSLIKTPRRAGSISVEAGAQAAKQEAPVKNIDVSIEEKIFKDAMREYERTAKKKYQTGIDPDAVHTVKELETVAADAAANMQPGNTRSVWTIISLACRKLGDGKENIEGWLGLLPDESAYFSVVCGGLKLALSAAARFNQVKDKILDALLQIPTLLNGAKRVLKIYKDSENLLSLSKAFYTSILAALGHILHYLQRRAASRAFEVVIQPASFQRKLLAKIDAVTVARDAFNNEADICEKEMLDQLTTATKEGNQTMVTALSYVLDATRDEFLRAAMAVKQRWDAIEQHNIDMQAKLDGISEEQTRQRVLLDQFLQFLQGGSGVLEFSLAQLRPIDAGGSRAVAALPAAKAEIVVRRRQDLLDCFRSDLSDAADDITAAYRLGPLLSRDDQERSVYVIRSSRLTGWLAVAQSAVLLVHGHAAAVRRRSAMTFVCARLSAALEQMRVTDRLDLAPLSFFCGEHLSNASRQGPVSLARSLLAQLLTHCPEIDVAKLNKMSKTDMTDCRLVWKRFVDALCQLPARMSVVCVVDGLSLYLDDEKTASKATRLLHDMVKMTRPPSSRKSKRPACAFKLLLTAQNRLHSREAESFDDSEILHVPAMLASTGGFVEMKWHLGVDQQLAHLPHSESE